MDFDFKRTIDAVREAQATLDYQAEKSREYAQKQAARKYEVEKANIETAKNTKKLNSQVDFLTEDLCKERDERKTADRKNQRWIIASFAIAFLSILIALAAWLFPIAG